MPLIQPEPKMTTERRNFRLRKDLLDKLSAYAHMIDSSADHVVSAGLDAIFNTDKDFQRYLVEHPELVSAMADGDKKRRGRPTKLKNVEPLTGSSAA